MREIKFRAWDKETGFFLPNEAINVLLDGDKVAGQMPPVNEVEMVERETQTGSYDGLIVKNIPIYSRYIETVRREVERPVEFLEGNPFTMERLTLMQYTGLKDKNGVEIYEGDIVEVEREGETWGAKPTHVRYEVKFSDGAFYTHREFTVNENKLPIVADWGEVIGNVHENPELLEAK